jgi:tripartite-type tricarboxylate transporter receptor subunit TctC
MSRWSKLAGAVAVLSILGSASQAREGWPARPVSLVVPFAAGGNTDAVARVAADYLQRAFTGSSFIVENRGGAGGIVGTAAVARAAPDGHTLCICSVGSITVAPSLEKLPYDPLSDLVPVSLVNTNALAVVVPPTLGINSLAELIAAAKAKPYSIEYGSSGAGGLMHISALLFQARTGTKLTHVPFRGGAPAVGAALASQVKLVFANMSDALSQVEGGMLKALAVTTRERSPQLPNVPTVEEAGVKPFHAESWNGLFAPRGTPHEIVERLASALAAMSKDSDVQRRFAGFGSQTAANRPAEFRQSLEAETAMWRELLQEAGLRKTD